MLGTGEDASEERNAEMSPRAIDSAVAEYCMGWSKEIDADMEFSGPHSPEYFWPEAKHGICPSFSTDPAASKQLREKMPSLVPMFRRLEIHIVPDGVYVMIATGTSEVDENYPIVVDGKTVESTLCLAALTAVGKPVEL